MKNMSKLFLFLALLLCGAGISAQTGQPFEVKVTGHGKQAILFIPGFACSGDVWRETLAKYEKKYLCYTLTMAGFAGVPAQANSSFAIWESAIAHYITEQKINKPVVIGHSMGGLLALALAADHPELISRVVVVDALPCLQAMMNPSFKSVEKPDCGATVQTIVDMNEEQFLAMQKMSMQRLIADTVHQAEVLQWSMRSDRKAFAEMYCDFSNTDLRDRIATIKCPCLILLESYFANMKPAISEQYTKLQTGQYEYATKGLHFIMYDDPDWYQAQLAHFLKH